MTTSVTHTFVSGIADDPTAAAAGEVLPSHWNASHTITGTAGSLLALDSSGVLQSVLIQNIPIGLDNNTFAAGAAQGTTIGNLSVPIGTGTYTLIASDDHSGAVQVSGTVLQVGPTTTSSPTSFNIIIHADNGAGSMVDRIFYITATSTSPSDPVPIIFN